MLQRCENGDSVLTAGQGISYAKMMLRLRVEHSMVANTHESERSEAYYKTDCCFEATADLPWVAPAP